MDKRRGWIRNVPQQKDEVNMKAHLTQFEQQTLTIIPSLFSGHRNDNGVLEGHCAATRHAFGISCAMHKYVMKTFVKSAFIMSRKPRSDTRTSIFNSAKKRQEVFTAFHTFKKRRNSKFCEFTEKIPHEILKEEFDNLLDDDKEAFKILAERDQVRCKHMWEELKELLKKTKG